MSDEEDSENVNYHELDHCDLIKCNFYLCFRSSVVVANTFLLSICATPLAWQLPTTPHQTSGTA